MAINQGGTIYPAGDSNPGLTRRDYFAAAALTGLWANSCLLQSCAHVGSEQGASPNVVAASFAWACADAMIRTQNIPTGEA